MNGDVDENASKEQETSLEDSYGTQTSLVVIEVRVGTPSTHPIVS